MDGRYSKYFTEKKFREKIKKHSKEAGVKVIYMVLLLYYSLSDKSVGLKNKLAITAALGYFILPTDALFDLTPLIGYSDDLGVLLFVFAQVSDCITPEAKQKARKKVEEWFGDSTGKELAEIEKQTS
jgi:uncharacterized membrane protein YkvA (DUF1232 family)